MVVQEVSRFSNTFFGLFNCFFFQLLQGKILIPSLPLALGPTNNMHFGVSLCPSLPESSVNERSAERKNPVLPGQGLLYLFIYLFIYLSALLLRVACSLKFSLLSSSFSFIATSPRQLWTVLGSPASPPLPVPYAASFLMHPGALTALDQGPWHNFPPASSLP